MTLRPRRQSAQNNENRRAGPPGAWTACRRTPSRRPPAELAEKRKAGLNPAPFLLRITACAFYNASPLDTKRLRGDHDCRRD